MTELSDQEKLDLLMNAASGNQRPDVERLMDVGRGLSPMEYLLFLNWASLLSRQSAYDRKIPAETIMIL